MTPTQVDRIGKTPVFRVGFLLGWFPNQEPGEEDLPCKKNPKILVVFGRIGVGFQERSPLSSPPGSSFFLFFFPLETTQKGNSLRRGSFF